MFNTIYDLIKDPTNPCNWIALFECILSIVAIVLGVGAALCIPEIAPLGVIVAFIGLGGVIFGHW